MAKTHTKAESSGGDRRRDGGLEPGASGASGEWVVGVACSRPHGDTPAVG